MRSGVASYLSRNQDLPKVVWKAFAIDGIVHKATSSVAMMRNTSTEPAVQEITRGGKGLRCVQEARLP